MVAVYGGHTWVDDDATKPLSAARVGELDNAAVEAHTRTQTPVAITYAATITPDATAGTVFYCIATGNVALADPTGGVDGKHITLAVQASGADRTVTYGGATVTIPSGEWWVGKLIYLATPAQWIVSDGI